MTPESVAAWALNAFVAAVTDAVSDLRQDGRPERRERGRVGEGVELILAIGRRGVVHAHADREEQRHRGQREHDRDVSPGVAEQATGDFGHPNNLVSHDILQQAPSRRDGGSSWRSVPAAVARAARRQRPRWLQVAGVSRR